MTVELEPESAHLGSGDFFGELALVTQQPRNADVRAAGFCDLLMLSTADFRVLMEANPEALEIIEQVAQERMHVDKDMIKRKQPDASTEPDA